MSTSQGWTKPVPRFQRMKYTNRLLLLQRELNRFADEYEQRGNHARALDLRTIALSIESPLTELGVYWQRYGGS